MKANNFFSNKENALIMTFIIIILSFVMIVIGINGGGELLSIGGFLIMFAAMLYPLFNKFIRK